MPSIRKELLVVGDRLLIRPEEGEGRTETGLVLPATALQQQTVRKGRVVEVGPGIPLADPTEIDEPWKKHRPAVARYLPLQAREGDVALYLEKAAVEVAFEGQRYVVVPHGAVLLLVREEIDLSEDLGPIAGLEED